MSARLAALGYEIETKYEPDGKGGMRYYSWDIKASPPFEKEWNSAVAKNSRRTDEIEAKEQDIVAHAGIEVREGQEIDAAGFARG